MVKKALKPKLPFRESEKGYRDSLFWLSVLNQIRRSNYSGEIAFINQNSKDFFEGSEKERRLHSDLQEDLLELEINATLLVYNGLKDFIDQKVPQEEHEIDWHTFYEEYNSLLDSDAGESATMYLDDLPIEEVKRLLTDAGYGSRILDTVFSASFDTFDGVEDSEVTSVRVIRNEQGEESEYFVGYGFDIRILEVRLIASTSSYYRDKYLFDEYRDIEIGDDVVEVILYLRADFTASIILDRASNVINNVEINSAKFRQNNRLY